QGHAKVVQKQAAKVAQTAPAISGQFFGGRVEKFFLRQVLEKHLDAFGCRQRGRLAATGWGKVPVKHGAHQLEHPATLQETAHAVLWPGQAGKSAGQGMSGGK